MELCRGKKRCRNCGHVESVDHAGCNTVCVHCKSKDHVATSKECPEFGRQKKIKDMSFENMSFFEAEEMVPRLFNKEEAPSFREKDFPVLACGSAV